jgi:nucleoid DNA-binding protein
LSAASGPPARATIPQTGEPIKIKASTTVGFRPASALRDKMGKKSQPKAKAPAKAKNK